MSSTEPEQQGSGDGNMDAVEILTHGQGLAFQLRDLLLNDDQINPVSGERLVLAEDLLDKIHDSFISALDSRHSVGSPSDQMAESGDTSDRPRPRSRSATASRRRRREICESQSWTEISSTLIHDGFAWRKYGQKHILDAKHSRKYYKCTYKDQYGCPAKKQVQQIGDDPLTYRTVYIFRHTCTDMISNAALNAPPTASSSQMLDLGSTSAAAQPADMNRASSSTMILNFQSNMHHSDDHNNSCNNNDDDDLMKQNYTTLNDQTTEDHDIAPVQEMTSGSYNNNLGTLSDVGGVMPNYMEDFMNNYSDDYSPYVSQPPDTQDWWFD